MGANFCFNTIAWCLNIFPGKLTVNALIHQPVARIFSSLGIIDIATFPDLLMSKPIRRDTDAILGGQNPPPVNAAVLGGLAGAKQHWERKSISERLQALNNAVAYGDDGIDLALRALSDLDLRVRRLAKRLLRDRFGEAGKEAFLNTWLINYFVTLNDWKLETYNYWNGITDPEGTMYSLGIFVNPYYSHEELCIRSASDTINSLSKDNNFEKVTALTVEVSDYFLDYVNEKNKLEAFRSIFALAKYDRQKIVSLRALQLGFSQVERQNSCEDKQQKDERVDSIANPEESRLYHVDIRSLLVLFPQLELLSTFGHYHNFFSQDNLTVQDFCRDKYTGNKLKTLILDDTNVNRTISALQPLNFPELEYFEIWLNNTQDILPTIKAIEPILSGKAAPRLKYLALCNCHTVDDSIEMLLQSPIIEQLAVLDFRMGLMTDRGVKYIVDCKKIENLKVLNISNNCISHVGMQQLQQLHCKIEAGKQYRSLKDRTSKMNRCWRSFE